MLSMSYHLVQGESILAVEIAMPLPNALNVYLDDEIGSVGYTRARKLAEGNVKRSHEKYELIGTVQIVPAAMCTVEL